MEEASTSTSTPMAAKPTVVRKTMAKQLTRKREDSPLHLAVRCGDFSAMKTILSDHIESEEELREMLQKQNQCGETALYVAAEYGDVEVVTELIRSWKQILYVVIMHIIIVASALAAFLFIKLNKIPLNLPNNIWALVLLFFYINATCMGPGAPTDKGAYDTGFFVVECVSHIFGLALVVFLLYCISPVVALWVGIPSSVWFIVSCCLCIYLSGVEDELQESQTNLPV